MATSFVGSAHLPLSDGQDSFDKVATSFDHDCTLAVAVTATALGLELSTTTELSAKLYTNRRKRLGPADEI